MKKIKSLLFFFSLALNVFLISLLIKNYLNEPINVIGVTKIDLNMGLSNDESLTFTIPKGSIIKNITPRKNLTENYNGYHFSLEFYSELPFLISQDSTVELEKGLKYSPEFPPFKPR